MSKRITAEQAAEYEKLEQLAEKIQESISNFDVAVLESNIPQEVKAKCLEITNGMDSFGLAYRLHPQTQWKGGDSSDPKNFVVTSPHIAEES
jgi:hypothetical protein